MTNLRDQILDFFSAQPIGKEFSAGDIAPLLNLPPTRSNRQKIAAACRYLIHWQLLDFRDSCPRLARRGTKLYFKPPR